MTERLHFHFSLSCIGEGNGNPLQCSCLENPRDGGAWWAAVSGVAHSWTWLERLSSSSNNLRRGSSPWWLSGEDSACQCRRLGLDPWVRRISPGEGNGNPLHNSCLGNPMARGAWRAIVHEVVKSWMHLSTYIFLHTNCQSHKTHLSSSEINTVFTQLLSLPLTIFPTRWPD